MNNKAIILIRDGWGYRLPGEDNALSLAKTPVADRIEKDYPTVMLAAHAEAVGLPPDTMGNSEVGHMTIGSGRITQQSLPRITASIEDGSFFDIVAFNQSIDHCEEKGSTLHLIALHQVAGVHSHRDHLYALLELCKRRDFDRVVIHVITDGRDEPVHSSLEHVEKTLDVCKEKGMGSIATISGRYFAMDRDKRWDRTQKAYETIVHAAGPTFTNPLASIKKSHSAEETDEFLTPRHAEGYEGIQSGDSVIFVNYRTDRPRQLTQAMVERDFDGFKRSPLDVFFVTMTKYYQPMNAHIAFDDVRLANVLGKVVSDAGLRQLRISETEKYAHVTFFFNAQVENPFPQEERILIHSPKVATYDLKPEMSVYEVTDTLLAKIEAEDFPFIVVNLVNPDMVGHTGVSDAIVKACEAVDECTGKLIEKGLAHGYDLLVFADHGNAEDQTPKYRTSHTCNPVPCSLVTAKDDLKAATLKQGRGLQDIAPTILDLLGLEKPREMGGESLIER